MKSKKRKNLTRDGRAVKSTGVLDVPTAQPLHGKMKVDDQAGKKGEGALVDQKPINDLPNTSEGLSRKAGLICAGIVFCASMMLYVRTLAPSVVFADSGELIYSAVKLGVAHPPGFPLYTLVAHLFTKLPVGNMAQRVNFASAFFAALTASMMTLVVAEVMASTALVSFLRRKKSRKDKKSKKGAPPPDNDAIRRLPLIMPAALSAGVFMAFSRTLWNYATISEVYTLNAFLITSIFFLILRWRRVVLKLSDVALHSESGKEKNTTGVQRRALDPDILIYLAGFFFGLGLCVHHVTVGLTLPAVALLVIRTRGYSFLTVKRVALAATCAVIGLGGYLFLPLAASHQNGLNWGNAITLESFYGHITGRQYQSLLGPPWKLLFVKHEFTNIFIHEFGPVWVPLGILMILAGIIFLYNRDRILFWFLLTIIIVDVLFKSIFQNAEDKDAYYLPSFMAMAIAFAYSGPMITFAAGKIKRLVRYGVPVAVCILALTPLAELYGNYPYDNHSNYFLAQDYANNILNSIEPRGMLLTADWQVYSPLLYFREVEMLRRDVKPISLRLLRTSWYLSYLAREYPELIFQSKHEINAFMEYLKKWENDPKAFGRDPSNVQSYNDKYIQMVQSLIDNQMRQGPVYITYEVIVADVDEDVKILRNTLASKCQAIPQGLLYKLTPSGKSGAPIEVSLTTRGLADGTLKLADDDTVKMKVIPAYRSMYYSQGMYYASIGQKDRGIEAFHRSLEIDPGFQECRSALIELEEQAGPAGVQGKD